MDNWKIINKIAKAFGIVFIVFTGLAAITSYELNTIVYPAAPASFIAMSILTATLPFIVSAVLSFTMVILVTRAIKADVEKETQVQTETKAKQVADLEKMPS